MVLFNRSSSMLCDVVGASAVLIVVVVAVVAIANDNIPK